MKRLFFFFVFLMGFACSRIGFHQEGAYPHPLSPTSHHLDSTSCEADSSLDSCLKSKEGAHSQENFFRIHREETKPGHLIEHFQIPYHRHSLEIMWVLDVSRSMDQNLKKTGQNLMAFLSHIQHKKWRMAFITADHGEHDGINHQSQHNWRRSQSIRPKFGKFMPLERRGKVLDFRILQYDTPHYSQIFKDTLTRENPSDCYKAPYCQGSIEQPLRSLQSAFKRHSIDPTHRNFFQADTDTVAIIITDEDEREHDPRNATTASEVIATFHQVFKGQRKRLFGLSISVQDEACYAQEAGAVSYGKRVGRLAELTLGPDLFSAQKARSGNISLCSKDYGQALADISKITRNATESITLEKLFYIPETVNIQLSPKQDQVSWRFYGRKLVFSPNIRPGTKIQVSYRYEQQTL